MFKAMGRSIKEAMGYYVPPEPFALTTRTSKGKRLVAPKAIDRKEVLERLTMVSTGIGRLSVVLDEAQIEARSVEFGDDAAKEIALKCIVALDECTILSEQNDMNYSSIQVTKDPQFVTKRHQKCCERIDNIDAAFWKVIQKICDEEQLVELTLNPPLTRPL